MITAAARPYTLVTHPIAVKAMELPIKPTASQGNQGHLSITTPVMGCVTEPLTAWHEIKNPIVVRLSPNFSFNNGTRGAKKFAWLSTTKCAKKMMPVPVQGKVRKDGFFAVSGLLFNFTSELGLLRCAQRHLDSFHPPTQGLSSRPAYPPRTHGKRPAVHGISSVGRQDKIHR